MSLRLGGGLLQITLQKYMKIHRYKLITNYITLRNITKILHENTMIRREHYKLH